MTAKAAVQQQHLHYVLGKVGSAVTGVGRFRPNDPVRPGTHKQTQRNSCLCIFCRYGSTRTWTCAKFTAGHGMALLLPALAYRDTLAVIVVLIMP